MVGATTSLNLEERIEAMKKEIETTKNEEVNKHEASPNDPDRIRGFFRGVVSAPFAKDTRASAATRTAGPPGGAIRPT